MRMRAHCEAATEPWGWDRAVRMRAGLFEFRPNKEVAFLVDLHMNHMRTTADGAVLDVLLVAALAKVDRKHDLLSTAFAQVRTFLVRGAAPSHCSTPFRVVSKQG